MEFQTKVDIQSSSWKISPCEKMLFLGSCFADNIGNRFREEQFRAIVNPFGVMYNPASILHSVQELLDSSHEIEGVESYEDRIPQVAIFTLGTNHVYILKETREIVDNCKRAGSIVSGPVPLPTKREIITILRAVHKYKDSREQFEQRTHKRLIDIVSPSSQITNTLQGLEMPAGVAIDIKMKNN